MKYKEMIEAARRRGVTNEDKMWKSIESVDDILNDINDEVLHRRFMRKQHEILYGEHYDEDMAKIEVDDISYTDRDGLKKRGAHWSVTEVDTAMRNYPFGSSVTKYDKWVAANAMYADTCSVLTDEQILHVAYEFYFNDIDWPCKESKIWQYMSAKEWYESKTAV